MRALGESLEEVSAHCYEDLISLAHCKLPRGTYLADAWISMMKGNVSLLVD